MPQISDRGISITLAILSAFLTCLFVMLIIDVRTSGSQIAYCGAGVGCRTNVVAMVVSGFLAALCLLLLVGSVSKRKRGPPS